MMRDAVSVENQLDIPALIERSGRRAPLAWTGYAFGMFLLLMLLASFFERRLELERAMVQALSGLVIILMLVGMTLASWFNLRANARQRRAAEAIEELIQLRRWPEAMSMAAGLLSGPVHNPMVRAQALLYLVPVLARYERFDDVIRLTDYLLETVALDPAGALGVRLARTMAFLRQDRLFDADRAISEMRRMDGGRTSGGLALVEMYRDVKTGHPDEALATAEQKGDLIRDQLGHRSADMHALAATALAMLGNEVAALAAWRRATLLSPARELVRRYPEIAPVAGRFAPPAEAGRPILAVHDGRAESFDRPEGQA